MAITASGIGSNLDVNGIVTQLMSIEKRPMTVLQQKQSSYESQISAYGTLKSQLSTLQSAATTLKDTSSFNIYQAKAVDASGQTTSAISATTDTFANAGTYNIKINQLAQSAKMITSNVADKTAATYGQAGTTIEVDFGTASGSFAATNDSSGNSRKLTVTLNGPTSLEGIRDAINSAAKNYNGDVTTNQMTASILNDGSSNPYRLTVTSNTSGASNNIKITVNNDDAGNALSGLLNYDPTSAGDTAKKIQNGQDATMTIDNTVNVSSSTNTFTDAIQGVTIKATKADPTAAYTMTVSRDNSAIQKNLQTFVDAYNTVQSTLSSGGALSNDNTLLSVQSNLSNILNNPSGGGSGSIKYLVDIGIQRDKYGKLSIADSSKLNKALDQNFTDVVNMFTNTTSGFATSAYNALKQVVGYDGTIDIRTKGLNEMVKDNKSQQNALQLRLDQIEKNLRSQYSKLDATLGSMNQTSTYLAAQLSRLG